MTIPPRQQRPERRQLTVMFCDLVGSTALSIRMDAEELADLTVSYREAVGRCVARFGGMVARYVGDGILAYFGYPHAREDAAERAIRAALAATGAVRNLATADGHRLGAHIGIATGEVVIGNLHTDRPAHSPARVRSATTEEISAVGEAPNLAAHLQSLVGADAVVVAATTRRLAGRLFRYRYLGLAAVKGFEGPVPAWTVIGERTVHSRFHALRAVGGAPMVGRARELARLEERWKAAREGNGQAVLLSGDPGLGKSRLAEAAVRRALQDGARQLWFYCAPHSQRSALAPLIRQLTLAARIDGSETERRKLLKLEAILPSSPVAGSDTVPLLADLLSIDYASDYPPLSRSPQRRRRDLMETVLSLLGTLATQRPVVAVVEDLHWSDPSSQELIEAAIDRIRTLPVMLLLTARPTFEAPWAAGVNLQEIGLRPLQHADSLALARSLTRGHTIADAVLDKIVDRADGIPLYIEDLTHDVVESARTSRVVEGRGPGPVDAETAVPASLQDSLMSRLDRIGTSAKHVAQVAAVFGREFSYDLLTSALEMPRGMVNTALDRLTSTGLVVQQHVEPGRTYAFRHVLIRDIAYSSLLRKDRARLHGLAARLLRDEHGDIAELQPELLAQHFELAGDIQTAADFWLAAGRRSASRSNFREAIDQLQHIVSLLAGQPRGGRAMHREMLAYIALGGAQAGYRGFSAPETGEAYERALALARELGRTDEYFLALSGAGSFHITRAEFDDCRALADECLTRAGQQATVPPFVIGRRLLGGTLFLTGELEAAVEQLERAVALYEERPSACRDTEMMYVQDHKSTALCYLALAYTVMGHLDRGLRAGQASLEHARRLGELHTTNFSLTYLAAVHHLRRDRPQTMERARESMDMALEQDFATWVGVSRMIYGEALVRQGRHQQGLESIMTGTVEHGTMQAVTYQPFGVSLLAKALLRVGRLGEAADALRRAETLIEQNGERWYLAEIQRLKGLVLLQGGDREGAEAGLRQAMALGHRQGARFWELRAATALAGVLAANGDRVQARSLIEPLYGWFTEGLDTEYLRAARGFLDQSRV